MLRRIDFNCDLGEGCDDAAVMAYISSANIACGLHAGDPQTMRDTIALCRQHDVSVGAHPSFDDRANFGRTAQAIAPEDAHALVLRQLGALGAIARAQDVALRHVKPHGALYNQAADDDALAEALARAVLDFDPMLTLYALSGSALTAAGARIGLRVAHEVFAERRYEANGRLTPRTLPGAVIDDLDTSLQQVRMLVRDGRVIARTGESVPLRADTLCLHGDRADAAQFARAVREALEAEEIEVAAPAQEIDA
jgi:5-oxoprolinase (ATP-hydrolysing) subunit A